MLFKVTTLLIISAWSHSILAQESLGGARLDNWRERCRGIVAGAYINDFDKIQQNQSRINQYTLQLKRLNHELSVVSADIATKTRQFDKDEFSKQLTLDLQRLKARQYAINSQIKQVNDVKKRTMESHHNSKKHLEELKVLVKPVFLKTKDLKARPGSYGFTLSYRSTCPKFRAVCALPAKQAAALAKISEFLDAATACERYATIK